MIKKIVDKIKNKWNEQNDEQKLYFTAQVFRDIDKLFLGILNVIYAIGFWIGVLGAIHISTTFIQEGGVVPFDEKTVIRFIVLLLPILMIVAFLTWMSNSASNRKTNIIVHYLTIDMIVMILSFFGVLITFYMFNDLLHVLWLLIVWIICKVIKLIIDVRNDKKYDISIVLDDTTIKGYYVLEKSKTCSMPEVVGDSIQVKNREVILQKLFNTTLKLSKEEIGLLESYLEMIFNNCELEDLYRNEAGELTTDEQENYIKVNQEMLLKAADAMLDDLFKYQNQYSDLLESKLDDDVVLDILEIRIPFILLSNIANDLLANSNKQVLFTMNNNRDTVNFDDMKYKEAFLKLQEIMKESIRNENYKHVIDKPLHKVDVHLVVCNLSNHIKQTKMDLYPSFNLGGEENE
ncbi:hypothetical protein [Breznakia pachnodae]|uniref:Uncharacterized protein n=1 Tax=Breznakia pachnodae TaxID=265178 RepID=A0ABU0E416_9FIRM|nr:hypothetical protein [Breznakia pachnodae]MDQ0361545.1 hypothetical protein [Breznakia pachnodae]